MANSEQTRRGGLTAVKEMKVTDFARHLPSLHSHKSEVPHFNVDGDQTMVMKMKMVMRMNMKIKMLMKMKMVNVAMV